MEIIKRVSIIAVTLFLLGLAPNVFAYEARIVSGTSGEIMFGSLQPTQYYYDDLKGAPREYSFSTEGEPLRVQLLVPAFSNPEGRYSLKITKAGDDSPVAEMGAEQSDWLETYDSWMREYYYQGPSISTDLDAGDYVLTVFSEENTGKYLLIAGVQDQYAFPALINFLWQVPFLKLTFYKTSLVGFLLTPFFAGLVAVMGLVIVLLLFIWFLVGVFQEQAKHRMAKTLLLTSGGMDMKQEIIGLLQKPAYDVNVAFIPTAAKPEADRAYVEADVRALQDLGFNVEQIDIDGKSEMQLMQQLALKDIIFVEGGNTFYLLNAMRKCNFEKILRQLLKRGIVYVGVSAGSIVAGTTIETADWKGVDKNTVGIKNLKGLGLVPFNVFVHYRPEHAEIIKQHMPNERKRQRNLRILTDGQAVLVQGKDSYLIGKGEQIII